MKTCSKCKYYKYVNNDIFSGFVCQHKKFREHIPVLKNNKDPEIRTLPNFGCVLFEGKVENERKD